MSNPNPVYESLLQELAAGELTRLERQVFELLRDNPDGLDRYQLVGKIYGYIPLSLTGNTDDRKIRKAISAMRKRLYPIVSTSRKPGYRLDVSREAAEKMLAELDSRIRHMQEQAEAVRKFWKIPMPKTYRPIHRTHKTISDQQLRMQI
jgi:hypothetical protein